MATELPEQTLAQRRNSLREAVRFHAEGKLGDAEDHFAGLSIDVIGSRMCSACCGGAALKVHLEIAISDWDQLRAMQPARLLAMLEKGAVELEVDAPEGAVEWKQTALSMSPDNPRALNNLAVALVDAQREELSDVGQPCP